MCNNCLGAERKHKRQSYNTFSELITEGRLNYLQVLEECTARLQSGV